MSRELIIATKVRCDWCRDTEVIIASTDPQRIDAMLARFYEWQVADDAHDDACLACMNAVADEDDDAEASR